MCFCFAAGTVWCSMCASTLCKHDLKNGDLLFGVGPGCDESVWELFIGSGGVYCCEVCVYVLFCNCVWVCVDVCCVSSVVECRVFLESGSVCVSSDGCSVFCLICDACSFRSI